MPDVRGSAHEGINSPESLGSVSHCWQRVGHAGLGDNGCMSEPSASFSELGQHELDRASIRMLSEPFCRRNHVVVLGKVDRAATDEPVTVGMVTPEDATTRMHIADFLQRPINVVQLNRHEVERALNAGFGAAGGATRADLIIRPRPASPRPDAVELVDRLLASAVARKASDIHVERYADDVDLRLRIDGILHQVFTEMAPGNVEEVVSRIKVLASLDISERRQPQDGRIRAAIHPDGEAHDESAGGGEPRVVDFRVSVVPSPWGEDVVIRILDASAGLVPVARLGMSAEAEALFLQLLTNPEGLVLVTGPTGSGKTTTLYAALAQINDGRRKIITAEDPIEYHVAKVNQKQVSAQLTHATLLRAMLRQDPNVLLVGELRDLETGSMALNAAGTGHLVLGTLHTGDAVGAVARLRGLGLDDTDIANALLAVLAQRLVRRICADCSQPGAVTPAQAELLGPLLDDVAVAEGRGCEACQYTGYRGRVGLYELLVADPGLQDLIVTGAHNAKLRAHARAHGFRTLVDDGLAKVAAGVTSVSELVRVVPYRHIVAARDDRGISGGRPGSPG
jgi:type II secretory ATPase GspE/PulE/Tfp pilus assembly ATPase PilB-like protein